MTVHERKLALLQLRLTTGVTMAAIGRSIDPPVGRSHVAAVVAEKDASERVQDAVAAALGMTRADCFPRHAAAEAT